VDQAPIAFDAIADDDAVGENTSSSAGETRPLVPTAEDLPGEEAESDTNDPAIHSANVLRMAREALEEDDSAEENGDQDEDDEAGGNVVYGNSRGVLSRQHSDTKSVDGKHHYDRLAT
jgi:hypothetical protein